MVWLEDSGAADLLLPWQTMALTPGGGAVFRLAAHHPCNQERGPRAATRKGPGRMTATARHEAPRRVGKEAPSSWADIRRLQPRGIIPEARWLPRRVLTDLDGVPPRRLIHELDIEQPRRLLSEPDEHQPCRMLPELDGLPRRAFPEWDGPGRKGSSGSARTGRRQPRHMLPEVDEVRPRRMVPEIDEVRPRRMFPEIDAVRPRRMMLDSDAAPPRRMVLELALVPPRRVLPGLTRGPEINEGAHRPQRLRSPGIAMG